MITFFACWCIYLTRINAKIRSIEFSKAVLAESSEPSESEFDVVVVVVVDVDVVEIAFKDFQYFFIKRKKRHHSRLTGQNSTLQVSSIWEQVGQFWLQGQPIWHSTDHSFANFSQNSKSSGNKPKDSYFDANVAGSGRVVFGSAVGKIAPVVNSG